MKRITGVDTARAIAALSVACAHLWGPHLPWLLKYIFTGGPAVAAFFVISGFCIHYPYRHKPLPIAAFWSARAIRILPPSILGIVLARLVGIKEYNFVDGYILWSIVCELFYYALYPALAYAARKTSWPIILGISIVVAYAVAIGVGSDQYGNVHVYGWYLNWVVMLPSWIIGCVVAEKIDDVGLYDLWLWRGLTALAASVLYWATLNTRAGFYLTLNPFAALAALWIVAEITAVRTKTSPFLERLGKWSYSIYLFHMIVSAAVHKLKIESSGPIGITFALLGSYGLYKCIELPAHRAARKVYKWVEGGGREAV